MNPAQPTFPVLNLVVPACLAVFALVCLVAGVAVRRRKRKPESLVDNICFFLAVQALVYAVSMLLFIYGQWDIIEDLAAWAPLLLSVLLVLFGARLRSPVLWTAGLATPGLGFFCQKLWVLLPFSAGISFVFPADPVWFFGLAALILVMPFTRQWRALWEDLEPVHTAASCMYVLAALWLLSSKHVSVLEAFGVAAHLWAGVLVAASLLVLWIARALRDPVLLGAGAAGVVAGCVEFLMQYPSA